VFEPRFGEHLTYEVYRRAGIAAPLTANAHVTINGIDSGIYAMREPINRDFLTRSFGRQFSRGNIYELNYQPDPMLQPNQILLRNEVDERRTRTELLGKDGSPGSQANHSALRRRWPLRLAPRW
jgi:hypothetical protein